MGERKEVRKTLNKILDRRMNEVNCDKIVAD